MLFLVVEDVALEEPSGRRCGAPEPQRYNNRRVGALEEEPSGRRCGPKPAEVRCAGVRRARGAQRQALRDLFFFLSLILIGCRARGAQRQALRGQVLQCCQVALEEPSGRRCGSALVACRTTSR